MTNRALQPTPDATPAARMAQTEWAARVRANNAQANRVREESERDDFYAPVADVFRADPTRTDDPALRALLGIARPQDVWLDVGAGGGRSSLGLARAVRRLIAIEPSQAMRAVFSETANEFKITNTDLRDERWPPPVGPLPDPAGFPADVAFISHVGYDIAEIGPFLDALEASASRTCAALLMSPGPIATFASLWPDVHGEPQAELPGLRDFLGLLLARGALPEMKLVTTHTWRFDSRANAEAAAMRRLWLTPQGGKADRLRAALSDSLLPDPSSANPDAVRAPHQSRVGLVTWTPPGADPVDD